MEYTIKDATQDHLMYLEQHTGMGIWEWPLKANQVKWSTGLFRILGLDPAATAPSFEPYRTLVHPEDRLDFEDRVAVATSGTLAHRNFRINRPSGEMRRIESHGQLMFGEDGKPSHMLGFALDVTETHAATTTQSAFTALLRAVRCSQGAGSGKPRPLA